MNKSVTLGDIAKKLGVSTVTVSNALGGKKGVSDELRGLIVQTAAELGYQKNPRPFREKKKSGFCIGVLICERYLDGGPTFYWELYQRVAAQASRQSCFVALEIVTGLMERTDTLPQMVEEDRIDGLIVIGTARNHYLKRLKESVKRPVLFMDFYDEDNRCDAVITNGFTGMYRMTNLLFGAGFTKIAFVGNILATSSIMDRYQGYVRSLLEHGQQERADWVISDRDMTIGQVRVKLPAQMPEAFVCNCDYTAEVLAQELEKAGYRVPEDISLVSYDDFLYSGKMQGHLTTFRVEQEAMAERGIRILLKRICGQEGDTHLCILDGRIVIRDSMRYLTGVRKKFSSSGRYREFEK